MAGIQKAELDCWEDASTSSEDDTNPTPPPPEHDPAPAPAPAPVASALVVPHQCNLSELPPFMIDMLSGAERAYVVEWEKIMEKFIRSTTEPSISFPPAAAELRQGLAYIAHVYRTEFVLAPFIHGTPKVACTLVRRPNSAIPVPRLSELPVSHQPQMAASLWPTRQAPAVDPRLQKGTAGVKIMRRNGTKTAEERQREELEKLERAAKERTGAGKGDKQLEYEMARARIFESGPPSAMVKDKPITQPAAPPANQATGPAGRGFGRGAPVAPSQQAVPQQPRDRGQRNAVQQQQPQQPQGQKWGNSALSTAGGNQSRRLEDMVDPDYDRSRWQQDAHEPQQSQQPTYWSEFPDLQ